jgi:hypothetical protein
MAALIQQCLGSLKGNACRPLPATAIMASALDPAWAAFQVTDCLVSIWAVLVRLPEVRFRSFVPIPAPGCSYSVTH